QTIQRIGELFLVFQKPEEIYHVTRLVDHEGFRHALNEVEFFADHRAYVRRIGVGDAIFRHERPRIILVVHVSNAENHHALITVAFPYGLKTWCFVTTGSAPACPEIDHHRTPPQFGQADGFAVKGRHHEVGRLSAGRLSLLGTQQRDAHHDHYHQYSRQQHNRAEAQSPSWGGWLGGFQFLQNIQISHYPTFLL